jgi:hypothetical protein
MNEAATPRQQRLRALGTKLDEQHRPVIAESGVLLVSLGTRISHALLMFLQFVDAIVTRVLGVL